MYTKEIKIVRNIKFLYFSVRQCKIQGNRKEKILQVLEEKFGIRLMEN
jgi:hypothetical protein